MNSLLFYPCSPDAAEVAILEEWRRAATFSISTFSLPVDLQPPPWANLAPGSRIAMALSLWTQASPRPLVIFIDEIDALQDENLSIEQAPAFLCCRPVRGFDSVG